MIAGIAQNVTTWVDKRLPLLSFLVHHVRHYPAPKNLNFWYYFGSFALVLLMNQIVTGVWLTMFYQPNPQMAFASVEGLMREVSFGWLLRYMHSTGASFFFIVVYAHMFRGLLYGSYKAPRELVWMIGCTLFVLMMAEAFFGYLLPWGQMSYWGAQVITSLFEALPFIGPTLALFIRGDYNISGVVLNRFFALHVAAIPMVFIGIVLIHLVALHSVGSNNPKGIDLQPEDKIPFHPYYTVKDFFGLSVLLFFFALVIFYFPEGGGLFLEAPNFTEANPLQTPEHIAPVWYMMPFYAILRAIPDKLMGIIAMGLAIVLWFFLPFLDRSPIRAVRYRAVIHQIMLSLFVGSFIILGYLGGQQPTPLLTQIARAATAGYFAFFILLPLYSSFEQDTSKLPRSLND
jgi:ubiquinol-cytochrome c reductase cytochrome b subunit